MTEASNPQVTARPVTVVVADDHPVVRDGLSVLLGLWPDVALVGRAATGTSAVEVALAARPDVIVMDLRMPGLGGVEATRRIKAAAPEVRVLVLTTYGDEDEVVAAFEAGATGLLTKDAGHEEIHEALMAVARGERVISHTAERALESAMQRTAEADAAETRPPDGLTARECDVLRLIAAGRSNAEIVAALHVSEATVKTHINRIFSKTRVRDRAQAVRYAYLHGFASPSDA
jgi:DNA-binding NarL/FixJ family response regulator